MHHAQRVPFARSIRLIAISIGLVAALWLVGNSSASAQDYPVTLTAEGPATACAGEDIAFTFGYRIDTTRVDGLGSFDIAQPANTSFVSLEPVGDTQGQIGHSNADPALADIHVFSSDSPTPSGAVRLVVRTAPTFSGTVNAGSLIRGTGTTASNRVLTVVAPCAAALPVTGRSGDHDAPLRLAESIFLTGAFVVFLALAALTREPARRHHTSHPKPR